MQLKIARSIGAQLLEASALYDMSLTDGEIGKAGEAAIHAEAALSILERIQSPRATEARARWIELSESPKRSLDRRFSQ